MPAHYTLTLESQNDNRKFTVNISVSNEFNPNDQKEIQEHKIMQILYRRICEEMFPYIPVVNSKRDMMASGFTEDQFYQLNIPEAVYPPRISDNVGMKINIR